LPAWSTATQKPAVGHETEITGAPEESMLTGTLQAEPFQVLASPLKSTAAQNVVEAQDTAAGSNVLPLVGLIARGGPHFARAGAAPSAASASSDRTSATAPLRTRRGQMIAAAEVRMYLANPSW